MHTHTLQVEQFTDQAIHELSLMLDKANQYELQVKIQWIHDQVGFYEKLLA